MWLADSTVAPLHAVPDAYFQGSQTGRMSRALERKENPMPIRRCLEDQLDDGMVPCHFLSHSSQLREWQEKKKKKNFTSSASQQD